MRNLIRIPLAFSSLWSFLAGLWIFLNAGGTRVTETIDSRGFSETTVEQLSFYQTQGWWGIVILLVFVTLYTAPIYFYQRRRTGLFILFALAAMALTLLAGFSVGPPYLPAAAVLIVALLLHLVVGNVPKRLRSE